jgi:putative transposase
VRQCQLLGISRSGWYYQSGGERDENQHLMRLIDAQYTRTPFYGYRRLTAWLRRLGHAVNKKPVARLMQRMGLAAIYPRARTSTPAPGHRIYPYLLRNVTIDRVDQVWSTDITYVPMPRGLLYLVAVMDWYSRFVLSWQVSTTLDGEFCLSALEQALEKGRPEIFNTDQGAQFTSLSLTGRLREAGVAISMDGRGRALDNIFVERLWRTVKYEEVYLKEYATVPAGMASLRAYFTFYNWERPHQSLDYKTPAAIYNGVQDNQVDTEFYLKRAVSLS